MKKYTLLLLLLLSLLLSFFFNLYVNYYWEQDTENQNKQVMDWAKVEI